ncbi:MAG TPA: TadE/TadG family type IV pilus assembly protein [Bryobacteraceae bacterium]
MTRIINPISARNKKGERGHAVVELAFVWSFLWLLITGVYQFGNAFFIYSRLEAAASNAAMLGSRLNYDIADSGASLTTKVKNMAVYGDPAGGSTPLVPSLTTANVSVDAPGPYPTHITVTIQNYTITNLFHNFALPDKPRVTAAYAGNVVCSSGC